MGGFLRDFPQSEGFDMIEPSNMFGIKTAIQWYVAMHLAQVLQVMEKHFFFAHVFLVPNNICVLTSNLFMMNKFCLDQERFWYKSKLLLSLSFRFRISLYEHDLTLTSKPMRPIVTVLESAAYLNLFQNSMPTKSNLY